jgi:hypothetical protein
MKKALSVDNVLSARFNVMAFDGQWCDAIGQPELSGTWIVYGSVKNGKTSFSMQLAKYLTRFGTVAYNSVEEGLSLSIQAALQHNEMADVSHYFVLLGKESPDELIERLHRKRSPQIIVIDTIQFWELNFKYYKIFKETFPDKLFIYVSHANNSQPESKVAIRIWRDANVSFRVEGFRAFPMGRYGGGKPIDINKELALKYWAK